MRFFGFKVQSPIKRVARWDSHTLTAIIDRLNELETAVKTHETTLNRIERKQNREGLTVRTPPPVPETDLAQFQREIESRVSSPWGF